MQNHQDFESTHTEAGEQTRQNHIQNAMNLTIGRCPSVDSNIAVDLNPFSSGI
jgi:hypothetical protein